MSISLSVSAQKSADNFIRNNLTFAQQLGRDYGIPPSIIMGIAMHESANGTSQNARDLNNFFGIKGSNNLTSRKSSYKGFENVKHCFESFCQMITRKSFYPILKGTGNYLKWLDALKKANYAEAFDWKSKVAATIENKNLNNYDFAF